MSPTDTNLIKIPTLNDYNKLWNMKMEKIFLESLTSIIIAETIFYLLFFFLHLQFVVYF